MVRVLLGLAEGNKQGLCLIRAIEGDRVVRPTEGRQQREARIAQRAYPRHVNDSVRSETAEQGVERSAAEVVESAEHGDAPDRLTVEHEGVVGALRGGDAAVDAADPTTDIKRFDRDVKEMQRRGPRMSPPEYGFGIG
jgi:hypothetical protein